MKTNFHSYPEFTGKAHRLTPIAWEMKISMYTQRQQVTGRGKNSKQRNTTALYVELYHNYQVKNDSVLKVSIKIGHHLL